MEQMLQQLFDLVKQPGESLVAGMIEESRDQSSPHVVEGKAIDQAGHITCELPARVRCAVIVIVQGNHHTIWKFGESRNDRTPRHFWGAQIYWSKFSQVL